LETPSDGNQPVDVLTMPWLKGKANYKVDLLIMVVEEKLPNGAQGLLEVATLYQHCSREKCCNKLKKLTGNPGDTIRNKILRYKQIQKRILKKPATIMGANSDGNAGLDLSEDSLESKEDTPAEGEDDKEEEVKAGDPLSYEDDDAVDNLAGIGSTTNSRSPTPTNVIDGAVDGGTGIMALEDLPIALLASLKSTTQLSAKGAFHNAPLYQPYYAQTLFRPAVTMHFQQHQLHQHSGYAAPGLGTVFVQQQPASQQPVSGQ